MRTPVSISIWEMEPPGPRAAVVGGGAMLVVVGGWGFSPLEWVMSAAATVATAATPPVIAAATMVSLTFHLLALDGLADSLLGRTGSLLSSAVA
jgi:hypothetical protein